MALSQQDAFAALRKVHHPELPRDLVACEIVKGVEVAGDKATVKLELPALIDPSKDKIGESVRAALEAAGAKDVELAWSSVVRGAPGGSGQLLPGVKNIVLVGAGKGGVGKSTVAVNLALALDRGGAKVGILDADVYGPSVPMLLGLTGQKPASRDGKSLEPLTAYGVKAMSIGMLVEPDQALIWRGPMVTGSLVQLMRDVNWGELDYLILDLPPGTGDVPLSLAQNVRSSGAVLVSTPQDVALADVLRAKAMFDKVGIPVLGIVENMSQFICPHCHEETPIFSHGGAKLGAGKMGIRFLGELPLELSVREGGDSGIPVTVANPDGAVAAAFFEVARNVAGAVAVQNLKAPRLPVIGMQARS